MSQILFSRNKMSKFLTSFRFFQMSASPLRQGEPGPGSGNTNITKPNPTVSTKANFMPGFQKVVPSILDRQFLIWSGHYKYKSEIPTALEKEVIDKARSWARIRINLGFMAVAVVGSIISIYLGKQAAKRGDTMETRNIEWHRKINEQYKLEQEALKKSQT